MNQCSVQKEEGIIFVAIQDFLYEGPSTSVGVPIIYFATFSEIEHMKYKNNWFVLEPTILHRSPSGQLFGKRPELIWT